MDHCTEKFIWKYFVQYNTQLNTFVEEAVYRCSVYSTLIISLCTNKGVIYINKSLLLFDYRRAAKEFSVEEWEICRRQRSTCSRRRERLPLHARLFTWNRSRSRWSVHTGASGHVRRAIDPKCNEPIESTPSDRI